MVILVEKAAFDTWFSEDCMHINFVRISSHFDGAALMEQP
jgi:hypothetical protein